MSQNYALQEYYIFDAFSVINQKYYQSFLNITAGIMPELFTPTTAPSPAKPTASHFPTSKSQPYLPFSTKSLLVIFLPILFFYSDLLTVADQVPNPTMGPSSKPDLFQIHICPLNLTSRLEMEMEKQESFVQKPELLCQKHQILSVLDSISKTRANIGGANHALSTRSEPSQINLIKIKENQQLAYSFFILILLLILMRLKLRSKQKSQKEQKVITTFWQINQEFFRQHYHERKKLSHPLYVIMRLRQIVLYLTTVEKQSGLSPNQRNFQELFARAYTSSQQVCFYLEDLAKLIETYLRVTEGSQIDLKKSVQFPFIRFRKLFFSQSLQQILRQKTLQEFSHYVLEIDGRLHLLRKFIHKIVESDPQKIRQPMSDLSQAIASQQLWKFIEVKQFAREQLQNFEGERRFLKKFLCFFSHAVHYDLGHIEDVDNNQKANKTSRPNLALIKTIKHYFLDPQEAEFKYYTVFRRPKLERGKSFMQFAEKGLFEKILSLRVPSIHTSFFMYIPRTWSERKLNESLFKIPKTPYDRIHAQSCFPLHCKNTGLSFIKRYSLGMVEKWKAREREEQSDIVIYVHGGGFMSNSSVTAQLYTRRWAQELKVPIFSLDYSKVPEGRYPIPVDEIERQYKFIIQEIEKHIDLKPRKIILAGDSAGGNLASALVIRLISSGYRKIPHGLLLFYPPTDFTGRYTPSGINGFEDPIAPVQFLHMCQEEYVGPDEMGYHIEVSPALMGCKTIKGKKNPFHDRWGKVWPRTRIVVGERDTLLDDSLDFLETLVNEGVDARLLLYKDLPHGFVTQPIFEPAFQDSIHLFKELLDSQ